jgi:glutamate-1-semialdehyde aminotransferase
MRASTPRIVSVDANGAPLVEYTRSGQGWIAQASYVFDPPIEIVARLAGLYALRETDPALTSDLEAHGQEVGSGINYYFEQHRMKVQASWIGRMPYDFAIREAAHGVCVLFDVTF